MIPIYRAKRIDNDEYVEGYLLPEYKGKLHLSIKWTRDFDGLTPNFIQIDPSTLAIHFPDMLDSQGNKMFASLQEDGKGGDIIISKSYPFYGDAPEITDSSGKCEELNYKGLLLFTSTGCYMDYIKVSDRVRGCAIEDFNEFELIGIQEW